MPCSTTGLSMNINWVFIAGAEGRLEYLGFHSHSEYDWIRAFKGRGIEGLSHSKLPKNLLYFLYRFPRSHVPREILLIGSNFTAARIIQSAKQ